MSDIVERLRRGPEGAGWSCDFAAESALIDEAADEIERLEAENEGLSNLVGCLITENERALRIGRAVLVCSLEPLDLRIVTMGDGNIVYTPGDLLERLLAAGDDEG